MQATEILQSGKWILSSLTLQASEVSWENVKEIQINGPISIYLNSNLAPRLLGITQKKSHPGLGMLIQIYRNWPIAHSSNVWRLLRMTFGLG